MFNGINGRGKVSQNKAQGNSLFQGYIYHRSSICLMSHQFVSIFFIKIDNNF